MNNSYGQHTAILFYKTNQNILAYETSIFLSQSRSSLCDKILEKKITCNTKKKNHKTLSKTNIGMILNCAFNIHQINALQWTVWLKHCHLLQRYDLGAIYNNFYRHIIWGFKNRLFQCTTNCQPAINQVGKKKSTDHNPQMKS